MDAVAATGLWLGANSQGEWWPAAGVAMSSLRRSPLERDAFYVKCDSAGLCRLAWRRQEARPGEGWPDFSWSAEPTYLIPSIPVAGTPAIATTTGRVWAFYRSADGRIGFLNVAPGGGLLGGNWVAGGSAVTDADVAVTAVNDTVYVFYKSPGPGAQPLLWARCESEPPVCSLLGTIPTDAVDHSPITSPYGPAAAGGTSGSWPGTVWIVYGAGSDAVLKVHLYWADYDVWVFTPNVVGPELATETGTPGCVKTSPTPDLSIVESPTAVVYGGSLHVVARVAETMNNSLVLPEFVRGRVPLFAEGMLVYSRASTPWSRSSWSRVVPMSPYVRGGAGPRFVAQPDDAGDLEFGFRYGSPWGEAPLREGREVWIISTRDH